MMAIKGTLAAFNFSTLDLATVDERRLLRKDLNTQSITLEKLDISIVGELLFPFFITDIEIILLDHLDDLLAQFNEALALLQNAAKAHATWYELLNIQRLYLTINEIAPALKANKEAFGVLLEKQKNLPIRMQILFHELREEKSQSAKMRVGREVFQLLCDIAGGKEGINASQKINEGHVNHSKELSERFTQGYVYHWSLEEEIKHIQFEQIFAKIQESDKEIYHQVRKLLDELAKTTNAVYNLNWKHIALIRRVYCLFAELAFKE